MLLLLSQSINHASNITGQGGGVVQGTASDAILVTLLAARDKILRKVGKESIDKLVVYSSDQAHSALLKACQVSINFCFPKKGNTLQYRAFVYVLRHFVPFDAVFVIYLINRH